MAIINAANLLPILDLVDYSWMKKNRKADMENNR
jgi:hypothetical protein